MPARSATSTARATSARPNRAVRGKSAVPRPEVRVTAELGPRAQAILRAKEIAALDLKAAGGAFTLEQVATVLNGVTRQRVEQLVRSRKLIAVPGESNRRSYPAFQFADDGTLIAGLDAVQAALPTQNPWAVLNFLVNPDDRLRGKRPIDVLEKGDVSSVIRAAKGYGEPGA